MEDNTGSVQIAIPSQEQLRQLVQQYIKPPEDELDDHMQIFASGLFCENTTVLVQGFLYVLKLTSKIFMGMQACIEIAC